MIPRPTVAQKEYLEKDAVRHRLWLRAHGIEEAAWPCHEVAYTALIYSGLMDPRSGASVCGALLKPTDCEPTVLEVRWPKAGPDLVVRFEIDRSERLLLVEHKQYKTHSHRPGYRSNPGGPWQTDAYYREANATDRPAWLARIDPLVPIDFVVIDAFGKSMDQIFPEARYNEFWRVVGYPDFGVSLRAAFKAEVGGLVPLVSGLYSSADWFD